MTSLNDRTRPGALPVLGVDVGGVLAERVATDSEASFFGDRPMETPAVRGALDALRALAPLFDYRVYIVSKAGPRIAELRTRWLARHRVTDVIAPNGLWFVRRRSEKAPICADLGITHFVDDRPDVLDTLTTVPNRYLFTGGLGSHLGRSHDSGRHSAVDDWAHLTDEIATSLRHIAPLTTADQGPLVSDR